MKPILTIVSLMVALAAQVYSNEQTGRGLHLLQDQELDHIHTKWKKVEAVRPNKLGMARIQLEHERLGKPAPTIKAIAQGEEEFSAVPLEESLATAVTLPASVNNSRLPSFPPIGSQGTEGSCVAWATTYYQATHEVGLANGLENQYNLANILSPAWTYNMINGGVDNGSSFVNAYALLSQNGAVTTSVFPYTSGKYLAWDTNPEDWLTALTNRLSPPQYIGGLNGTPQDLSQIKMALINGHVLTFGTFVDSWVYGKVGSVPGGPIYNQYLGQLAVSYMNSTQQGAHMATIVGYNDNIWIDVNGNGKIDPGETGAFLIANSWGASWGNGGLVWISYDAFLATSAVTPKPPAQRQALAGPSNSYAMLATAKATHYIPSLVAEFKLAISERNRLQIAAGVSDMTQTTPSTHFASGALAYQGGIYDFSGFIKNSPQTSTFCLDLTDLVPLGDRYYFLLSDYLITATVDEFSLVDLVNDAVIPCTNTTFPQNITSGNTAQYYIDYMMPMNPPPPIITTTQICWPANNQTVSGVIPIMVQAPSKVFSVSFSVDSTTVANDFSLPYILLYDTTALANGVHTISVTSYTGVVPYQEASVTVTVTN